MSGLTFEQMKSLIQTDFFDIDQIKTIKAALEKNENPNLHLSDEQVQQLANIAQLDD